MANLAPHETLELHELVSVSISEIKNLANSIPNVRDEDLRNYLNKYVNTKKTNLENIQKLVDSISTK